MVASTEKVSLSLDAGALVLGRRAAELEGTNLSAYISRLLLRHAWDSERPTLAPGEQALTDALVVEQDELEEDSWGADGHRAAG